MDPVLRVYNSLTRSLQPLEPRTPGKIGMYVCGMTVYDYCHIGHARAMITFDVIHRYLAWRGFDVTFVRNHTDVDDKIIHKAQKEGVDALELSARYIQALDEDLAGLGLRKPTHQPKVSEHIPQILALIQQILDRGHGYVVDGDVFFDVGSFPYYGQLSGRSVEDMRAGERIAIDERKRNPADFALWKSAQPGEPWWDSPWGRGRPGWHIECSAMSTFYLGNAFDIHGGGSDLIFPHHENEVAQSEAGTGIRPFVHTWMHNGMVNLGEEKMSKSLGNIITIREILRQMPGETLKLLYLEAHYRSPVPYSSERLSDALIALDRLYQAREMAEEGARTALAGGIPSLADAVRDFGAPAAELAALANGFADRVREAMDEDFNTSKVLADLFDLVRATNRFAALPKARRKGASVLAAAHQAFLVVADVLGIGEREPRAFFEEMKEKRLAVQGLARDWVEERLQERNDARKAKDWARADQIRQDLDARNIVVMDGAEGSTWRIRM